MSNAKGFAVSLCVALAFGGLNCDDSTFDADPGEIRQATTINVAVAPEGASPAEARVLVVELQLNAGKIGKRDHDGATQCPVLDDDARATANGVPMRLTVRGGEAAYDEDGDFDETDDVGNDGMGCSGPERRCHNPRFELDLAEHPYLLEAPSIDARVEGEGGALRAHVFNPARTPTARLVRDDGSPVAGDVRPGDRLRFVVEPAELSAEDDPGWAFVHIDGLEASPPPGRPPRTYSVSLFTDESKAASFDAGGIAFAAPAVPFAVEATVALDASYTSCVFACEGAADCARNGGVGYPEVEFRATAPLLLVAPVR
jgi:hypothetical protein